MEDLVLFKKKAPDGTNNLCSSKLIEFRRKNNLSQYELAVKFQLEGLPYEKNTIQQIECGKRFVTDIELPYYSIVLGINLEELLSESDVSMIYKNSC